jgi:hypothetical protein
MRELISQLLCGLQRLVEAISDFTHVAVEV